MIWIFEHGSYSDRHLAPALHGPARADIPALYAEFVSSARGVGLEDPVEIQLMSATQQKAMGLDLKEAASVGLEEYCHADMFVAWLLQKHPAEWRFAAERRVAIDSDNLRRLWDS